MKKLWNLLVKIEQFLYDWVKFLVTLVSLATICYVLLILGYAIVLILWMTCTKGF